MLQVHESNRGRLSNLFIIFEMAVNHMKVRVSSNIAIKFQENIGYVLQQSRITEKEPIKKLS
jgi:hypothetical protein